MSKGFMSQMTRPEEGERGLGASHRRGGMGEASYRRPPEDRRSEGLVKALGRVESPTSKAPGVKRKVESMRDKGAKRTANRKLHIDDGCMGGGKDIDHKNEIGFNDPSAPIDFYDYKNGPSPTFDDTRNGIFHYCIMADERYDTTSSGVSYSNEDDFIVAAGSWIKDEGVKGIAGTFMHELGHNLGLTKNANSIWPKGVFSGIDMDEDASNYHYSNYKSCMNYKYQTSLVDYSDGSNDSSGVDDHDDWGNLNLKGIERWAVHE